MKIATWNVNGIKARIDNLCKWLEESSPDIACLQEIKSVDEGFPASRIEEMGYHVETHGQKGFNGVALLSKVDPIEISRGLPGDDQDVQSRFISGIYPTNSGPITVGCLYLPNGNPVNTEKYPYKISWMRRLNTWAKQRLSLEQTFVLAGDFNVIPTSEDVHDPAAWQGDALFRPETHREFQELLHLGLTEAFRACDSRPHQYSFWDYQRGARQQNHGIRIDHCLLSPQMADLLHSCHIESYVRDWERPSDHVPVVIKIDT
ncbi:MAG: exodeoxyribonuclease III [Cohaesibacteraceae bacterium]|nr:exodeoxyribonuclease III [Cohaesibacteraceae bacterium]